VSQCVVDLFVLFFFQVNCDIFAVFFPYFSPFRLKTLICCSSSSKENEKQLTVGLEGGVVKHLPPLSSPVKSLVMFNNVVLGAGRDGSVPVWNVEVRAAERPIRYFGNFS
jgi:hypothetical protein